ncbi:Poly(rC)-binding protein 2 [Coemansia sp. RSA 2320]|nr:Poly(rC)-binding protein 2 [Coemansia sp. RSA 2320]
MAPASLALFLIDPDCDLGQPCEVRVDKQTRTEPVGSCHASGPASDGEGTVAFDEARLLERPATPGTPEPKLQSAPQLMLRLVFPPEDGGMLIGKGGCHINKLKADTSAAWSIAGCNTSHEDRVVVICGSAKQIIHAVHALTDHMECQQQRPSAASSSSTSRPQDLTLRLLFPASCIGLILGPGGARSTKLRADTQISRLHIFRDNMPLSDERIVEMSGTRSALNQAFENLLREAGSALTSQQGLSTLYKPVRHGLRRLQSQDRLPLGVSSSRADVYRPAPPQDGPARKRSQSMLGLEEAESGHGGSDSYQRKRRMSDNPEADRWPDRRRHSRCTSPPTRSSSSSSSLARSRTTRNPPAARAAATNRRPSSDAKEEKLVIPDSIAGRLIGRNRANLILLENQSGAQIKLSPRVQNMPDRVVTVVGHPGQVSVAYKLIKDSVQSFEDLEA